VQDGTAVLVVRDHGPGIPEEQRETLLKPFYRGTQDRGQPGTGLGLPVVERAVRRHGGQLQLQDATPGLRVVLRLPLATPPRGEGP
jgi:two-component system, OmpR family, osmolarity sensor histidine kinase EnvZ